MMNRLFKIFLLVIILGSLGACSPEKRLFRLVALHPELIRTDTLTVHDTVVLPRILTDTMLISARSVDTFFVEKEKLSIRIIKNYDTIQVRGEVKPDTVFIEKKVLVQKIEVKKPGFWQRWPAALLKYSWIVALLLVIIWFVISRLRR